MSRIRSLLLKAYKKFRKKNKATPETESRFSLEKTFLSPRYQNHNVKRLAHLDLLGLDLKKKKVIEFGAGIGDHTYYFLIKDCNILPSEGRKELVEIIANRFGINAVELNLETDLSRIEQLGYFDYAYCYGLLYHLKNPAEALRAIHKVADTILLETAVSADKSNYGPNVVSETSASPTQAISGFGSRPNRKWLYDELRKLYEFVYIPKNMPEHDEFPKNWSDMSADNLDKYEYKRAVFVASKIEIINNNLSSEYLYEFN